MVLVSVNKPFVLVADVSQVFYVKDMSTKPKRGKNDDHSIVNEIKHHIVHFGKRNVVEIEDKSDMCLREIRPSSI